MNRTDVVLTELINGLIDGSRIVKHGYCTENPDDELKYVFWDSVECTFDAALKLLDGDTSDYDSLDSMYDFYAKYNLSNAGSSLVAYVEGARHAIRIIKTLLPE